MSLDVWSLRAASLPRAKAHGYVDQDLHATLPREACREESSHHGRCIDKENCNLIRWKIKHAQPLKGDPYLACHCRQNPATKSRVTSTLIASFLSRANHCSFCLIGLALPLTFKEGSIKFRGTLGMSAGFHANTSTLLLKNLTSASSYLGSRLAPIRAFCWGRRRPAGSPCAPLT